MKIYTVQRQDKFDYDFSALLVNLGCYSDKTKAIARAKREYERMQGEYEDEMLKYSDKDIYDPEEYDSGALYVETNDEDGYYIITYGADEHYESHGVWVDEWDLEGEVDSDAYSTYRKCKRELLIEDLKSKAIEMEIDLEDKDIEAIADIAERTLDNNEGLWESYWMSLEYALE